MRSSKCCFENLCSFLQGIWFLLKEYIFVFVTVLIIFATSVLYRFGCVGEAFSIGVGGIALTVFFTIFPQKYSERRNQFGKIQTALVWFENIRNGLLIFKQRFVIQYAEDIKKVPQPANLKKYSTLDYDETLTSTFPETEFYKRDYAEKLGFVVEYDPVYFIVWYQAYELLISLNEVIKGRNIRLSTFVRDGKILFDDNFYKFKNFHEKYCYALNEVIDNALVLNQKCFEQLIHYGKLHSPFNSRKLFNQFQLGHEHLMPDEKIFSRWDDIFSKIKKRDK